MLCGTAGGGLGGGGGGVKVAAAVHSIAAGTKPESRWQKEPPSAAALISHRLHNV